MSKTKVRQCIVADIPPNSPETSWQETDDVGSWVLIVKATIGKTDVTLRYDVPVADPDARLEPEEPT